MESSLYSLTGPVDHPNTQIDPLCHILSLITDTLPRDPLIAKTALQLIYNSTNQLMSRECVVIGLFSYIVSFLREPAVQVLSA